MCMLTYLCTSFHMYVCLYIVTMRMQWALAACVCVCIYIYTYVHMHKCISACLHVFLYL